MTCKAYSVFFFTLLSHWRNGTIVAHISVALVHDTMFSLPLEVCYQWSLSGAYDGIRGQ